MSWNTTQPSLLRRVRDSADHESWRQFETQYGSLIVRYCRSRGVQLADAEDIRQIVMIGLSSALRSFHYDPEKGRFRTYLGRAVRNAISLTRKCPYGEHLSLSEIGANLLDGLQSQSNCDSDKVWDQIWREHHLRIAFRTLKSSHGKRVIRVFERLLDGKPINEVAGEFGLSVEAVKKIKQRVRTRLTEIIANQVSQESDFDTQSSRRFSTTDR